MFHQIYGRIEQFPEKLGLGCHGCVSHRHDPPPSLLTSILLSIRAPKILQIYQILGFAGVLKVILGAVMCIYMRWCSGYENGLVCPWAQPGCKPCSVIFKMSLVMIVWPPGSKTRQTSRIRRDSENWVIVGHTPKLPKIIDRRNVQVYPH